MRKISVIGATLVAAAMLCAAPISLHQSQDKGLSLSVDKAQASMASTADFIDAMDIITTATITIIATTATTTIIASTIITITAIGST